VQLSPVSIVHSDAQPYHFVYPPSLREWPPLQALRQWLRDELDRSQHDLRTRAANAGRRRRANGT
jgi:LysR family glycine cleavage system transcriptional activator